MQQILSESIVDNEVVALLLSTKGKMPTRMEFKEVSRALLINHNLNYPILKLKKTTHYILSGRRIPILPTLLNGRVGPRKGKDETYNQFWKLVEEELPRYEDRHYIGLPANQITSLHLHIGGRITSCEKKKDMAEWQTKVAEILCPEVEVVQDNIFRHIWDCTNSNWNVFDYDLMCAASCGLTERIAKTTQEIALPGIIVVNVATCIGRNITWKRYREIMPLGLLDAFVDQGFKIRKNISGHYRDRQVPVAWEHIAIYR